MKIFKQKAGMISKEDCWICFHKEYMYIGDTLPGLFWVMLTGWKHDRNLI